MAFRITARTNGFGESLSFNLTPMIDIVFQLIIFFSVTSRFIEAENFPVEVPRPLQFAQADETPGVQLTTLTVMKGSAGRSEFAVGSEKVTASNYDEIAGKLTVLLDARLKDLPADKRIVTLRVDKDIPYAEVQYALAAVAASTATDIRIAALRDNSGQ